MGKVSEEVITQWKAKHRKVREVTITDEGEDFVGYFRRPDESTLAAVNKLNKTDEVRAAMTMFDSCWLGGDELIKEDAVLKMAAVAQLAGMMEVQKAEVKNL